MSRFPRLAVLLAATALLVAVAPAGAPAATDDGPTATASRSCSVGDSGSYNTTYVLWIRARNVSCRRARRLIREFHKCRPGPRGRCPRVSGYRCSENRGPFGRGSFYSTVKCKRGGKVVRHRYNQWT
jgi:hypothetical protein